MYRVGGGAPVLEIFLTKTFFSASLSKKKAKPKTRMKYFEKEEEKNPVCPPLANTNGPSEYLSRRSLILLWIKTKTCGEKCFNIFAILFTSTTCTFAHAPVILLSVCPQVSVQRGNILDQTCAWDGFDKSEERVMTQYILFSFKWSRRSH